MLKRPIAPCLWYDSEAEEAAKLYVSIFPDSKIKDITRYGKEGFEIHGQPEGKVLTVEYELNGQPFTNLNGGPIFKFNESVSFQIFCETQEEIDHYWYKLIADGGKESECGWLKDKFGASWQVTPIILEELLKEPARAGRVTNAFLKMRKFDIEALLKA
jgi:predicted 3-demethylubiquinone-9 3-methyltransferase (glyoxalase superfamily)